MDDESRKYLIEFYKLYWFGQLTLGLPFLHLQIELLAAEEDERYEECEGIKQAKEYYVELLNKLDESDIRESSSDKEEGQKTETD